MAADFQLPLGATPTDNGEFLLGRVAVTPVFFQSDGSRDESTQQFDAAEIDEVLATIDEGLNWWTDALANLDTVHELEFVVDDTFARDPFETSYEPIDRPSTDFNLYVGEFLVDQGFEDVGSIEEGVAALNHRQRQRLQTDWAMTIFMVDSSDDADGFFPSGGFRGAFAFAGGLFIVSPSTRPASTIAHELGHQFWARDEYPGGGSFEDRRGYYDTANDNAADNPAPGFEQQPSIMAGGGLLTSAYGDAISPASTLAMVGWQDSDGDGVFDVLDVPLSLTATGRVVVDGDGGWSLRVTGTAAAVPMRNQNSSGNQSDITINRVDAIEYRIADGPWIVVATPQSFVADFDLDVHLPAGVDPADLQVRAIDRRTGITSGVVSAAADGILASGGGLTVDLGFAGSMNDAESIPDTPTGRVVVEVLSADGSALPGGIVDAADHEIDRLLPPPESMTIQFETDAGPFDERRVLHDAGVTLSALSDEPPVLGYRDPASGRWVSRLQDDAVAVIRFDSPVASVDLDVLGTDGSFARAEAYDAAGNLLTRQTTGALSSDGAATTDRSTLSLRQYNSAIDSVRVFGHAGTSIELAAIRTGGRRSVVIDDVDLDRPELLPIRIDDLAHGSYRLEVSAENSIYHWMPIDVIVGPGATIASAAADRVDSIWTNVDNAVDVNADGQVQPLDALLVINRLRRNQSGILGPRTGDDVAIDVSNDGVLSPLDALLVINFLRRSEREGAGEDDSGGGLAEGEAASIHVSAMPPIDQLRLGPFAGKDFESSRSVDHHTAVDRSMATDQPTGQPTDRAVDFDGSADHAGRPDRSHRADSFDIPPSSTSRAVRAADTTGDPLPSGIGFRLEL